MKKYRIRRSSERGAVRVESSLALPFFLIVLLALVDLSRVSYTLVALQYALHTAARWSVTGQTLNDPNTGNALSRAQSLETKIQQIGDTLNVGIESSEMRFCLIDQPGCTVNNVGGSGGFFKITIDKRVPVFFQVFDLSISRAIIVKNEPF